jgi:hypothetical protein
LEEFTELIKSLEPDMEHQEIVRLFRKALEYEVDEENLDAMEPSSFCAIALESNLGGFGKNIFEEVIASEELAAYYLIDDRKIVTARKVKGKKK